MTAAQARHEAAAAPTVLGLVRRDPRDVPSASFGALIGPIRLRSTQPWLTVQRFVVIQ